MSRNSAKYFLLLCTSFLLYGNIYSQQSTKGTSIFYPFEIGNYWEYFVDGWMGVRDDTSKSYIERDSLIASRTYKVRKSKSRTSIYATYSYERVDNNGNVYTVDITTGNETLLYRFSDTSKTIWPSRAFLAKFDTLRMQNVFSAMRKVLRIYFFSTYDTTKVLFVKEFAEDIGLLKDYTDHFQGGFLNAARINGVTYGNIVLSVNALSNPNGFFLQQNYPNPFNPKTTIRFSIPSSVVTTVKVFNVNGQEISTLIHGNLQAGEYSVTWSPTGLASGIYYYQLKSGRHQEIKPMIFAK